MYFKTTLLLAALHLLLGFLYIGVATFSTSLIKELRDEEYFFHRQYIDSTNHFGTVFNHTIENVQYSNNTFKNVTFVNLSLNHVDFLNCTIEESEFVNVKSSVSYFRKSIIKDSR